MSGRRVASVVVGALMLALSVGAIAGEASTALGDPRTADPFKDEPEPWRGYFEAARKAEQHGDALERCLAYPDLPQTQWPTGYAAAHCHYHLGRVPTMAEVDAMVSSGDVDALEQRVNVLSAVHDGEGPEREIIHRFFDQFSEAPRDGVRIAEQWVKQAPDSPAAAVAFGSALKGAGWDARGGAWAQETPKPQMREMSAYFDQAETAFRNAIKHEPNWVYPYIGLMEIGKADRDDVEEWGFAQAHALDPGCAELVFRRMQSLKPRWGGSWRAMEAYARQIESYVEQRPLLANQLSEPLADFVSALENEQRRSPQALAMLEQAVQLSGLEDALDDAAEAIINPTEGQGDHRRGAALLLQASRFKPVKTWANRAIGSYFVRLDPVWARQVLKRAVAAEPDSAFGRYYLGAANFNAGYFEEAETHYLAAAESSEYLGSALSELAAMWLIESGLETPEATAKARPFVERLLQAQPKHQDGLYLQIFLEAGSEGGTWDEELIQDYLAVADAKDPQQAQRRADLLNLLEVLKKEKSGKGEGGG